MSLTCMMCSCGLPETYRPPPPVNRSVPRKEDDPSPSRVGIWAKEKRDRAFFIHNAVEKKDGEENGVTLFLRNHEIVRKGSATDDATGDSRNWSDPLLVVFQRRAGMFSQQEDQGQRECGESRPRKRGRESG
jgi:hypothetical protein